MTRDVPGAGRAAGPDADASGAAAHNSRFYGRAAITRRYASLSWILPAEQAILARLGDVLPRASMLDLGVGGGRTAFHFAPQAAAYVGVDYVLAMVEACRARFAGGAEGGALAGRRLEFLAGDARALPADWSGRFDLVLFSYNGIDCLDGDDRPQVLREAARVLRPGGLFCHSFHNLNAVEALRRWRERPGPADKARALFHRSVLRLLNPDLEERLRADGTLLRDTGNRWRGRHYYSRPARERRLLSEAGFDLLAAWPATSADPFPAPEAADASIEPWIYCLSRLSRLSRPRDPAGHPAVKG